MRIPYVYMIEMQGEENACFVNTANHVEKAPRSAQGRSFYAAVASPHYGRKTK